MPRYTPATEKFLNSLSEQFAKNPSKPLNETKIEDYREGTKLFKTFSEDLIIEGKELSIPNGEGASIHATLYAPSNADDPLPLLIFFPGGAFIANLGIGGGPCSKIAALSNCKVLMVDGYRLAPEHKFPAGLNDAYAAVQWVLKHANSLGIDINKIAIGGDSSGGNFAALIAIRARDEGLTIAHQFLVSPATDLSRKVRNEFSDIAKFEQDPLLTPALAEWAYNHYLPSDIPHDDPSVSPYWTKDLTNLAPATIIVAEYDGLRTDSDAYAKRLQEANNEVELKVCQGQIHSFMIARKALHDGEDPSVLIANKMNEIFLKKTLNCQC